MRSTSSGTVLSACSCSRTRVALGADVEQAAAGEAPEVGEARVLGQAPVEHQALGLAVLRREAEAGARSPRAGLPGARRSPSTRTSPSSGDLECRR